MPLCRILRFPFLSAAFLVGFLSLFLLAPEQSLAHRVNVFAWTEGPQVAVECAFSGGKSVRQGLITVFDAATGEKLLEGRTDDEGNFRFDAPPQGRAHGLRIRVNAGEGHQNEWVLDAADLAATAQPTAQEAAVPAPAAASPAALPAADAAPAARADAADAAPSGGASPALTPEAVRQIVDAALEQKLAPLRRDLAQLRAQGPRLTEIVGGIGWLVGLAGLGLYFKGRRG
ncbi:hypothetical protein [Desulfovibrio legallii]|jgi:nickel transport protein|uniref:Nickel transport protein n=1 Tax=Desulfovibrio legallii TaxID=571438 RepID=A0A1G7I7H8_9BACT|nr:hypothetical protein [Desulfovibrio legallii]SDF08424.1 nickel transport protein [Desulfovibrio legallii]